MNAQGNSPPEKIRSLGLQRTDYGAWFLEFVGCRRLASFRCEADDARGARGRICELQADRRAQKATAAGSYPIGAPPADVQQLDFVRGGNGPWPTWRRCVKACGRVCPRSKKFEMRISRTKLWRRLPWPSPRRSSSVSRRCDRPPTTTPRQCYAERRPITSAAWHTWPSRSPMA